MDHWKTSGRIVADIPGSNLNGCLGWVSGKTPEESLVEFMGKPKPHRNSERYPKNSPRENIGRKFCLIRGFIEKCLERRTIFWSVSESNLSMTMSVNKRTIRNCYRGCTEILWMGIPIC